MSPSFPSPPRPSVLPAALLRRQALPARLSFSPGFQGHCARTREGPRARMSLSLRLLRSRPLFPSSPPSALLQLSPLASSQRLLRVHPGRRERHLCLSHVHRVRRGAHCAAIAHGFTATGRPSLAVSLGAAALAAPRLGGRWRRGGRRWRGRREGEEGERGWRRGRSAERREREEKRRRVFKLHSSRFSTAHTNGRSGDRGREREKPQERRQRAAAESGRE